MRREALMFFWKERETICAVFAVLIIVCALIYGERIWSATMGLVY